MPFYEANAAQKCAFVQPKIGSEFRSMKSVVGLARFRAAKARNQ